MTQVKTYPKPIATARRNNLQTYEVYKRTFEAKEHPPGSEARAKLNESAVTSEYMTSYKYAIISERFSTTTRTSAEAMTQLANLTRP